MQGLAVRARGAVSHLPAFRRWAGGVMAALVLSAVLVILAAVPPTYTLWIGDRQIAAGRDLAALRAAWSDWAYHEMEREIMLEAEGQTWAYRLGELGLVVAPGYLAEAFSHAEQAVPWWRRFPWSEPRLRLDAAPSWDLDRLEAALAPLKAAVSRSPVPAELRIVQRRPVITPEVAGLAVETGEVLRLLQGLGGADRLQVPVEQKMPDVTRESLERLGIRRLISEWSTQYDPTIPRAENVEKAAGAFNGLMLKPGEILSYNGTVGPISAATGWKQAYVIVNGELVPGVGGGVCQVATTLYGAALRANMEILERHPHQLVVTYISPSQDAAIAQGWEDLKLRNTTAGHLLVETEAGGGRVTFRLYGDAAEDQEVRVESLVLGSRPFQTRVVPDPAQPSGQQKVKMPGQPGLISEAYRLVYRGGQLVKRELLSRDSYLPTTEVIVAGPAPAPGLPPPPLPVNHS